MFLDLEVWQVPKFLSDEQLVNSIFLIEWNFQESWVLQVYAFKLKWSKIFSLVYYKAVFLEVQCKET